MKDPFKHSDKAFVAGENRIYIGELPPNPAHTDVPNYMTGGRRLSMESMDRLRTEDGRTLRQFLSDEAAKPREERQ